MAGNQRDPTGAPSGDGASRPRMAEVAEWRQDAYELLSALMLPPDQIDFPAAPRLARRLRRRSDWATALGFYAVWSAFLWRAEQLGTVPVDSLGREYASLFGLNPFHDPVPLNESAYLDPAAMLSGWVMARLETHYASAGLALLTDAVESPDHASMEMEFVSLLCRNEARAWAAEDARQARRALRRQQRFLKDHLMQWFPRVARAVHRREPEGTYACIVDAAHRIIAHDVDFLGSLLSHIELAPERET